MFFVSKYIILFSPIALVSSKDISVNKIKIVHLFFLSYINTTRKYSPLRGLSSSSCGGLWPGLFWPFGQKRLIMLFWPILGHFWCSVVTLGTFSSNLNNLFLNPKKSKKSQKKVQLGSEKSLNNPKNTKNVKNTITFFF